MISKERLKELIEQKATIYSVYCGEVFEEKLTSNHFVGVADDEISLMQRYNGYEKDLVDYIRCLYETEEEANWVAEFKDIERTEKLELPTWEEVQKCSLYTLYFNNQELYLYRVYFNRDAKTITIEEQNEEYLECFTEIEELELTKENYLKACRKCKKLFLGGSDGDIR